MEELVSKFESCVPESGRKLQGMTRKSATVQSFHSVKTFRKHCSSSGRPDPDGQLKPIQLTSGMAEEKAALLVRKFFGNSVIENKKSRLAKTETIPEEGDEHPARRIHPPDHQQEHKERTSHPSHLGDSFDSDDLFGSALDLLDSTLDLLDSTDDDDSRYSSIHTRASSRTRASMTPTTVHRHSSCSERSVKLSDIINRPLATSAFDSGSSNSFIDALRLFIQ